MLYKNLAFERKKKQTNAMANNRKSSRAYLVVELWSSSEAIIFFIVEGIEYEGI